MEKINNSILDGSNEEASKRLEKIIKDLENKNNKGVEVSSETRN